MPLPNENNEIEELREEIEELKEQVGQLRYPLDRETKSILGDVVNDEILNTFWDNYFYFFTHFESSQGWGLSDGSGGNSGVDNEGLLLSTGTLPQWESSVSKIHPPSSPKEMFNFEIRFRSSVHFFNTEHTIFVMTIGSGYSPPVGADWVGYYYKHFGFLMEDGILYGVSQTAEGTTEKQNKIELMEIEDNYKYILEARIQPAQKTIRFSVSDKFLTQVVGEEIPFEPLVFRGAISGAPNVPFGGKEAGAWIVIGIYPKIEIDIATLQVRINYLEYIQQRKRIIK